MCIRKPRTHVSVLLRLGINAPEALRRAHRDCRLKVGLRQAYVHSTMGRSAESQTRQIVDQPNLVAEHYGAGGGIRNTTI